MRPILALLAVLPLAGCPQADILAGKPSEFQRYNERLTRLEAAVAAPAPVAQAVPTPAPVAQAVPTAAPIAAAAEPVPGIAPPSAPEPVAVEPPAPAVCVAIFRVLSCGDNGEFIWL